MKPSEQFALDAFLSYYPAKLTYDEVIEAMTDRENNAQAQYIDVWQTVEDYDYEQIAEWIDDTRTHIELSVRQIIADTGYQVALRELLNYTGGWDITDENHPIFKARAVLNWELDI